ncbi:AraC family transcriptional regulator [Kluyvera ascorbata]|nr:helix-turn-helix transcriptional regulator [Kluyvera ascorbata]
MSKLAVQKKQALFCANLNYSESKLNYLDIAIMTPELLLDRIEFDDLYAEFRRVEGKSVDYYHWHQCLEVLYIEAGVGIVVVDNQQYTLRPGRIFIFPQGKLHKVTVESSQSNIYKRNILHIDASVLTSYFNAFNEFKVVLENISATDSKAFVYDLGQSQDYIRRMLDLYEVKYRSVSNKVEVMAVLLLNLFQLFSEDAYVRTAATGKISSKIMRLIERDFRTRLTLKDIAENLDISQSYASRVFRKETGGTIQEYLLIRRVKYACDLLENTKLSVAQIAELAGFNHATYFIRCFKELLGCAPLRYRNRQNQ